MNKLIVNFLVTVEAAEKFQMESGTERGPPKAAPAGSPIAAAVDADEAFFGSTAQLNGSTFLTSHAFCKFL
ncbi:hypothetical protein PIB30_015924 [Stylosanthes scabra]|uniref:Uncharacterized protein n=1 Tax=Stylosanthes scabra TaxID=79078 RepID=A0ABU6U7G5_9FABA|nr:hypothetical protein [Stylosanthes scabra]